MCLCQIHVLEKSYISSSALCVKKTKTVGLLYYVLYSKCNI